MIGDHPTCDKIGGYDRPPDTLKGIYIGTGGDVVLVAVDATAGAVGVVFRNLAAGSLLPVRARRVLATGTTAADMLALL